METVAAGEIEEAVVEELRAVFRSPELIAPTLRAAQAHEADELEIMTSNIGATIIKNQSSLGFKQTSSDRGYEEMKKELLEEVEKNFRPEFLNRLPFSVQTLRTQNAPRRENAMRSSTVIFLAPLNHSRGFSRHESLSRRLL